MFRIERAVDGDRDVYRDGKLQYRIDPHPRVLADFDAMCWYQAISPRQMVFGIMLDRVPREPA